MKKIGIVDISYSKEGKVQTADFTPFPMQVRPENLHGLDYNKGDNSQQVIERANLVVAEWFNQVAEIEFADREQLELKGNVLLCESYENGSPSRCVIEYNLVEVELLTI